MNKQSHISVSVTYPAYPRSNKKHPDTTTVFHIRQYDRFIKIESNLERKKLYRTNQGSKFLGGSFSNGNNGRSLLQFRRERQL